MDAKLNAFERITGEQKKEDVTWSNYVNLIDQFIYFGK